MFIAHRGKHSREVEENSLSSFKMACEDNKYVGFECDVRQSSDGEFIICHDAIYKNNLIRYQSKDKLVSLGLTTLDEVINIDTNKIMLLEIKDFNINIKKLVDTLNSSKNKIYVMSFSKEVIRKLKQYVLNFKVGILNYVLNSQSNYNNYDFICLLDSTITPSIIKYFNDKKIEIFSYGIIKLKKEYSNIYYIVDEDNLSFMKNN